MQLVLCDMHVRDDPISATSYLQGISALANLFLIQCHCLLQYMWVIVLTVEVRRS